MYAAAAATRRSAKIWLAAASFFGRYTARMSTAMWALREETKPAPTKVSHTTSSRAISSLHGSGTEST